MSNHFITKYHFYGNTAVNESINFSYPLSSFSQIEMRPLSRGKTTHVLHLSRVSQHEHIFHQGEKDKSKRHKQEVVYCLEVWDTRQLGVHRSQHITDGQYSGDAETNTSGYSVRVNPEAHPWKRYNANARDVHLKDIVHRTALKMDGHGEAGERLWKKVRGFM